MRLIEKIKAVWNKMVKVNDAKNIFGIETGRSSDMDTALSLYKSMRSGVPKWCASGKIKPTRFSNVVCREIANLTLFNADIRITGNNELQKRFDKVMNTLQEKQEESCATCGMMVKSNGDDVEFLDPDYFLITDTNTDGDALAAIFFSFLKKNDKYYTKAEYHRFEDVGLERVYHISSKAFKSDNKDMIGTEITLDRVDEWKDIEPEVYVQGLEYPLFVYWRNPYANAIDKESPLTVPAFSECIEELRWLDIALSKMGDEQEDSQHMTFVSQSAIQFANAQGIELPRFVSGLEQGINEDNTIHEHVPTLLVTDRVSAINFYLSIIGYKCGFSNGYFSFDQNQGIQTATQVESDDRRTLHTIQAFRNILDGKNHDGILHRIIYILYAVGTANGTIPATNYQTACDFEDLVYNLEDDRSRWWNYVLQGKVPAWMYFVKFESMTESEAKAMIKEAQEQNKPNSGLFDEE
jgi:A118 family predicted phage portal protein